MVTVEREDVGPWEVVWLDNGVLRLGLVPALGGRLLSLRFGGLELLWRNASLVDERLRPVDGHMPASAAGSMGDWVNYGGDKTWPAPQGWDHSGQWAGPPDPVLDSGVYAVDVSGGSVTMTSGADPRTGLRLTRRVDLQPDSGSYRLDLTATNTLDRPVRWALWNVTQFPGDGEVSVSLAGRKAPEVVELVAGTGNPTFAYFGDHVVIPAQDVVGKLGFPDASGSLTYSGNGVTITQRFAVDETAEYPDSDSRAEVWLEHPLPEPLAHLGNLDPPGRIVECEILGPLTTLSPGASTHLAIEHDVGGFVQERPL
jgi:hypothetical protein